MPYEVVDIIGEVPEADQTRFKLKWLLNNGECEAQVALKKWKRSSAEDYKKMHSGLKMVAKNLEADLIAIGRVVPDHNGTAIRELKAIRGAARLLYFYEIVDGEACAVFAGQYWKVGDGKKETADQEKSFSDAAKSMNSYLDQEKRRKEKGSDEGKKRPRPSSNGSH